MNRSSKKTFVSLFSGGGGLDIGLKHGYKSKKFENRFAKIILIEGKHLDFIRDVKKYTDHSLGNITEAKRYVETKFEENGLLKRNLGRAAKPGNTKEFSNQFQAWSKLGIIPSKPSERYIKSYGFNFNEERIKEIINL